jgi:hypothetical protein
MWHVAAVVWDLCSTLQTKVLVVVEAVAVQELGVALPYKEVLVVLAAVAGAALLTDLEALGV